MHTRYIYVCCLREMKNYSRKTDREKTNPILLKKGAELVLLKKQSIRSVAKDYLKKLKGKDINNVGIFY